MSISTLHKGDDDDDDNDDDDNNNNNNNNNQQIVFLFPLIMPTYDSCALWNGTGQM